MRANMNVSHSAYATSRLVTTRLVVLVCLVVVGVGLVLDNALRFHVEVISKQMTLFVIHESCNSYSAYEADDEDRQRGLASSGHSLGR